MFKRFRHRRLNAETRKQYRETFLQASDFVLPLFIVQGTEIKREIPSLKNVYHLSVDQLASYLKPLVEEQGLSEVLLFPVPDEKGIEQAYDPSGPVQQAVKAIRLLFPGLRIICDVCLCAFTKDGHCHVGDNDATLPILAKIARSYAQAGAHIVAPSDMMDGRVQAIAAAITEFDCRILSYSAKYASSYYGPFRDATDCAPKNGNRAQYQMDPGNRLEGLDESIADIEEGADYLMVKPALSYLDVIRDISRETTQTLYAYNVSGEYMMLNNAVSSGIAGERIIYESLLSIKRAGADKIISYFTPRILSDLITKPDEVNCL